MYRWTIGRDLRSRLLEQSVGNESSLFDSETVYDTGGMPKVTFEIPKPMLLTPKQIQVELSKTESLGRFVRAEIADPAIQQRRTTNFDSLAPSPLEIDWSGFKEWPSKQNSRTHARALYNFAFNYHESAFDAKKAALLKTMTDTKRHYVVEDPSALAKFTRRHDLWVQTKKSAGLIWISKNNLQVVQGTLSQESNNAID